jgi:predicted TIM-barrel fold metal-dependent hydrolase
MLLPRRTFLQGAVLGAATLSTGAMNAAASSAPAAVPGRQASDPVIIDTNVNLFEWPYRRLKYGDDTAALVAKLKSHGVTQAWAGSYEALFHKNITAVNARLAAECRAHGAGFLVPFGTVNPMWPDWAEDLRRCQEVHRMPGVRIFPLYQHIRLGAPEFAAFLAEAGRRGLIVQIVGDMEDHRIHHPSLTVINFDADGLRRALQAAPQTKVQLLHATNQLAGAKRTAIVRDTQAVFDISRFEGNGILARVLGVEQPLGPLPEGRVPLDRLLFGSHAPFFPVEATVMRLFESPLTLAQLTAIMEGNARRFLGSARLG